MRMLFLRGPPSPPPVGLPPFLEGRRPLRAEAHSPGPALKDSWVLSVSHLPDSSCHDRVDTGSTFLTVTFFSGLNSVQELIMFLCPGPALGCSPIMQKEARRGPRPQRHPAELGEGTHRSNVSE